MAQTISKTSGTNQKIVNNQLSFWRITPKTQMTPNKDALYTFAWSGKRQVLRGRSFLIKKEKIVSTAQKGIQTALPKKQGWVEHDPEEIWTSQSSVMIEALGK